MTDFTLVIPTFNRPHQLRALLQYLARTEWNIVVLDSSTEIKGLAQISFEYQVCYPADIHPFDKFADGVSRVTTPYCALLADDDLILPAAVEPCLNVLRAHPDVAVVQGFAFSFARQNTEFMFKGVLRLSPTIEDESALARVGKLLGSYRALTYGIYRTDTLRKVLAAANQMDSLLGRELLAGALTAIEGKIVNLPMFSHGRDGAPATQRYLNWHPLEWLVKDADGMMREYARYRTILKRALFEKEMGAADPPVMSERRPIDQYLDLIHWRYLTNYARMPVLDYIIENLATSGKIPLNDAWPPELSKMLEDAEHGEMMPIIVASALEQVHESLRRYGQAMVDTTAKVEESTA